MVLKIAKKKHGQEKRLQLMLEHASKHMEQATSCCAAPNAVNQKLFQNSSIPLRWEPRLAANSNLMSTTVQGNLPNPAYDELLVIPNPLIQWLSRSPRSYDLNSAQEINPNTTRRHQFMWTNKSITILGLTKQSDSSGWGEGVPTSWSRTCSWRGRPGCRTPPSCTAPCSAAPSPRLPPPAAATTAAAAGRTEQFNTASRSEFFWIGTDPCFASSGGRRFREDSQHLGLVGSLLWLPAGPYSARARVGPEWPALLLAASVDAQSRPPPPSTRFDVSTARSCPPRTQRGEQSPDEDAEIFPAGDGAAVGTIPSDSWR
jgi:hypothetical protein